MKEKQNWLIWLILLITLIRVGTYTVLEIGNTIFWWVLEFAIIMIFAILAYKSPNENTAAKAKPVKYFLIWNFICILRGFFVASNYWEFKNLVGTGFMLFIPLVVYILDDTLFLQNLIRRWFKYMPILFIFLIPYTFGTEHGADLYGKYFIPVLFLLPFIMLLSPKYRYYLLFLTIVVLFFSLDARSNIIRFIFALIIGLSYYCRRSISIKLLRITGFTFYLLPIILLSLGIFGMFNIFKMNEYIEGDYESTTNINGKSKSSSLTADTRTFLYEEVLQSAVKHEYVLFGRTPARGYDSEYFRKMVSKDLKMNTKERFGSEVAVHNIFTWNGLIGVVLYFLVFIKASLLALYKSKSYLMKLLGVFVAFRWTYAFVEDFTTFELQYLFLWVTIGMCYSTKFRRMTDLEIKIWVNGIFDKRYRKLAYFNNKRKLHGI
ncbi:hypothetical protein [Flavobacterium sp. 14A]|uniref:hypothetical protein n=1 Tax=Flavobacterium sp. 14A TaxID=2735896 RepID=UPI0015710314|nr:hypothetical protein [Flavobacterium sp. 14A]NRT13281.1 hypothetical protein [Flavobacterium sp. 14A]